MDEMQKIREWARDKGHKVGVRGPIAMPVIAQYYREQTAWDVFKAEAEAEASDA